MFTLYSKDISVGGAVSASSLYDQAKNRYNMHFSDSKMDGRLLVRISPRLISFFYYDYDYDEKEGTFIKDSSYEREVGSISLTRPEHTGRDILAFPQTIEGLKLLETSGSANKTKDSILKDIKDCNKLWAERFWGFPLAENGQPTAPEEIFRTFLRYCLLCFILEFENRDMAFSEFPKYDEVRSLLRQSDVYNLLSAKLHYTLYLHKEKSSSYNQERYSYYTREFAEILMSKSLIEAIPPENYSSNRPWRRAQREKQAWFYNPEDELEHILRKNRNNKECKLDSSLVTSIRSFLYTKHAIYRSMTTSCSKVLFWMSQILMLLFNIGLVVNCFCDIKNDCWTTILNYYIRIGLFIIFLVGVSGFFNKSFTNAFLPRIVVAEVTGWLTIGLVDELVRSTMSVDNGNLYIAVIVVFLLAMVLLYGEAKQHSPYCDCVRNVWKSAKILNHSVFFALLIGLLMQIFLYRNLLETSDVLSEAVYKEHFDNVGEYVRNLEECEKSINTYRGSIWNLEDRINLSTNPNSPVSEDVYSFHDILVDNVNASAKEVRTMIERAGVDNMGFSDTLSRIIHLNKKGGISTIKANLIKINTMTIFLKKEIQEGQTHLKDECFDTMLKWATRGETTSDNQYSSAYIKKLIEKDTQRKLCYKMDSGCSPKNIYHSLLLLHMLIVLVLAFVGQLVISDKSVTEPL